MLRSLRNKEALHSHCRDNRRLRGSLVRKLSHRRRDPGRGQYHRQSGLPRPDLPRLHRDRFLPADGAWPEFLIGGAFWAGLLATAGSLVGMALSDAILAWLEAREFRAPTGVPPTGAQEKKRPRA